MLLGVLQRLSLRADKMNTERIRQVLEIESQAQTIYEEALRQAEEIQSQSEQETQALIEQVRREARQEARQLIADSRSSEDCERILAEADEYARDVEIRAAAHFDEAVNYILNRVAGRE
jgi:vacuolar-type H+-ATPase subunit H